MEIVRFNKRVLCDAANLNIQKCSEISKWELQWRYMNNGNIWFIAQSYHMALEDLEYSVQVLHTYIYILGNDTILYHD